MTALKRKEEEKKKTNTAKQLLGPDTEFRSPLMCLFFAFVPVEGSLRSGTGQEAAQAAAQGKALDRRQSRSLASPGPGRRAGASRRWGAQRDPALGGLGHPLAPLPAAPRPPLLRQPKSHAPSSLTAGPDSAP